MNNHNILPIYILRQLIRADFESGTLYWLERPIEFFEDGEQTAAHSCKRWNSKNANNEAFTAKSNGYKCGAIFNRLYKSHRIIFALFHDHWPGNEIDHINQVRSDNRISNLREVTRGENSKNSSMMSNNTTGFTGVIWDKSRNKWRAEIRREGKSIHLGRHIKLSDAVAARKAANEKYGFSPNHGRAKD